jgi:hypothetical protein
VVEGVTAGGVACLIGIGWLTPMPPHPAVSATTHPKIGSLSCRTTGFPREALKYRSLQHTKSKRNLISVISPSSYEFLGFFSTLPRMIEAGGTLLLYLLKNKAVFMFATRSFH